MRNLIIVLFLFLFAPFNKINAHEIFIHDVQIPSVKEQKAIDSNYKMRLKLTQEQVEVLKEMRIKHKKEMQKIVKDMVKIHHSIRDVYLTGIPKYQADFRTAKYKAELALLNQNAKNLKKQYRKNILNVLDETQKEEYLIILDEIKNKGKMSP